MENNLTQDSVSHLNIIMRSRAISVLDYMGDDGDTAAFTRAVAELRPLGGGVLKVPNRIYNITRTVKGYEQGQFNMAQNYAVLVDFSNLTIEGDGSGLSILRAADPVTTILLYSGAGLAHFDLRGVTLEQPDAADWYANCATSLQRRGLDPSKATNYIDQGWTLGTLVYFVGTPMAYMRDVRVSGCELRNPSRHGAGFGYLNVLDISRNFVRYYDGFGPPMDSQNALGAGRVAWFVGSEPVHDIIATNNYFNGNVAGNKPIARADGTYMKMSADGVFWFAKGGKNIISKNIIENYGLEATHVSAAPTSVEGNTFWTVTDTPSAVACLAYPFSTDTVDVDRSIINFNKNTVYGGAGGLWTKGPWWVFPTNSWLSPRCRVNACNNILENVINPFAPVSADIFTCNSNTVTGCNQFICHNVTPNDSKLTTINFRAKIVDLTGNTVMGCMDTPLVFNSPLSNGGIITITGGVYARSGGGSHALLAAPKAGESYSLRLNGPVWLDQKGKVEAAPVLYGKTLPPGVNII